VAPRQPETRLPLLARLLLLVAAALLPAIGFQLYAEVRAREVRERLVHEEALRLARAAAAEQARLVEGTRLLLTAAALVPAVSSGSAEECIAYLQEVTRHFPQYANMARAELDGRVICSARPETVGVDVRDRAWFLDAVREGRFVTGEYVVSRGNGRPSIAFGQPVGGHDGGVTGALGATIDLSWLSEQVARFPLPEQASLTLLDRNGLVLARRPALRDTVGRPAPERLLRLLAERSDGTTVLEGLDGTRRILGYVPLGRMPEGMLVAVGLDASLAFAAAERASAVAFALIGLGTLLALLIVGAGTRRLVVAPASALLAAAGRWRSGDLSARVDGGGMQGASPELRGLARAFDGMAADLHAREAALRESEARFRAMADNIPQLAWMARPDGYIFWHNRRWFDFTGTTPAEMEGWGWTAVHHPDHVSRVTEGLRRSFAGGEPWEDTFPLRRWDGEWRWFLSRAAPVRDGAGTVTLWFGTDTDVTAQREAEAVLARSHEELERLVGERTTALRESEARLAQAAKMEALGRLAGGVAHDFNNVLQAVQGGVSLARRRLPRDPGGAERFLTLATDAAARGASVTGRLLAFARRTGLEAVAVDPAALLEGIAELLRHTFGPGVTIRVTVAQGTPPVLADAGRLESVLVNLANNARDALPGGRGTIALSAAPAGAPPGLPAGDHVLFAVRDDGEGMPPDILAQVTEPFFTTKPKGRGTGLGLSMARGFAEQSGGALHIDSAPGRGTEVRIWLPRAERADGTAAPEEPARAAERTMSLLVVDDDPGVRAIMAAALEDRGHAVLAAPGGAEALAAIERGVQPDALVTDLAMPGGLDGLDLIREARRRRPGLPAVLVTGHIGDATQGALEEAGAAGHFVVLTKPVSPEAVEARLTELLRKAGAERAA
jgi:PAS domain S-box-containing protein